MAFDGKDYIRWGVNIYDENGDMCGFYHDEKPYILQDGVVYNWDGKIRGCIQNGSVVWKKMELREHDGKFYERRELDIYDDDEKACGFYFDWKAYIIQGNGIYTWGGQQSGFIIADSIVWTGSMAGAWAGSTWAIAPTPPPASPIAEPLPYGWIERVSEKVHKGETYYVNIYTKEKTWVKPVKYQPYQPLGLIQERKAYRAQVAV